MKLGDLLNRLAAKQGLQNNQTLIDLLSNADFANNNIKMLMLKERRAEEQIMRKAIAMSDNLISE
jgi:hypothetical protein